MSRTLVVNADDFGRSPGINRAVLRAHEHGIVTSASLMVRWPAAVQAAASARAFPDLGLGLHVDLGEWAYRDGSWAAVYRVVDEGDAAAVEVEIERQLERFRELVGRDPTHVDSHQHVHRESPVRDVVRALGARLGIPVRGEEIAYIGRFYGQTGTGEPLPGGVSVEHLAEIVRALPPGMSELGCHPGEGTDPDSSYDLERALETDALCDPSIRTVLAEQKVSLRSFASRKRPVARGHAGTIRRS